MFYRSGFKNSILFLTLLACLSLGAKVQAEEQVLFRINEPLKVNLEACKLTMTDVIKLALLNNPVVNIERSLLEEKAWMVKEERSYLYPTLYFSETFMSSNNPVQAFMMQLSQRNLDISSIDINHPGTENNFATRLGGAFTIFDRSLYRRIDISRLEQKIQLSLGKKAVDELIMNARKAYLDVQLAQKRVENIRTVINLAKDQLKTIENRRETGTASKSEFLSATYRVSKAEEDLVEAKNDLNLAWIVLADIVGDESIVGFDLIDQMKESYLVDDIDKLVRYSYLHRPEIRAIEIEKDKAIVNRNLAKTTGALTLNTQAEWGVDTIFDDAAIAQSFTAGVFLRRNLFDGGLKKAKVKQAEAVIMRRDSEIDQTYRKVKLEVVQNYLSLKNSEEKLKMVSSMLADAEESLRAYKERYGVGLSANIEVESAQVKMAEALYLRTNALYDLKLAVVSLQKSIGMPVSDIISGKELVFVTPAMKQDSKVNDINSGVNKQNNNDIIEFKLPDDTEEDASDESNLFNRFPLDDKEINQGIKIKPDEDYNKLDDNLDKGNKIKQKSDDLNQPDIINNNSMAVNKSLTETESEPASVFDSDKIIEVNLIDKSDTAYSNYLEKISKILIKG